MKIGEQILKKTKKTAPQYNSNSLNCNKNQDKTNNSPSYCCAAINETIETEQKPYNTLQLTTIHTAFINF